MIHGAVPRDGGDPAPEVIDVSLELVQVPGGLQPGLRRDVLGVVVHEEGEVAQQLRLDFTVQDAEALGIATLRALYGRGELVGFLIRYDGIIG
jgi:hypothetical protein